MDYNYIRMRNAAKDGNTELEAYYRALYESGADMKPSSHIIDYALILLTVIAIILGVYTLHYGKSVNGFSQQSVTAADAAADNN